MSFLIVEFWNAWSDCSILWIAVWLNWLKRTWRTCWKKNWFVFNQKSLFAFTFARARSSTLIKSFQIRISFLLPFNKRLQTLGHCCIRSWKSIHFLLINIHKKIESTSVINETRLDLRWSNGLSDVTWFNNSRRPEETVAKALKSYQYESIWLFSVNRTFVTMCRPRFQRFVLVEIHNH